MFKIASCIFIAVCINFQQVVAAASFPYSLGSLGSRGVFGPLGSLLDNTKDTILDAKDKISDVKDKVSDMQDEMLNSFPDILQNIIEQKDEALQNINNMSDMGKEIGTKISTGLQKIKDKGEQFMEEAQNIDIPPCNRLYNRGLAVLMNLISKSSDCLFNKIREINGGFQDLIEVLDILRENVPKRIQNARQCLRDNTSKQISCVFEAIRGISKLGITVAKAAKAVTQLTLLYPSVKMCCEVEAAKLISTNLIDFIKDAPLCVSSRFVKNIQ
ncbi:uncharacterized protein LOC105180749 [Harpegnathos saltator]|uniref:uncharacterized protein LOC105180749 n=1 Tax=Harpegnathos saltator TaxID=610380 RepID=UPI000DBEE3BB|nr:uncharacterized protein LOC105180749 [Harpegnathos saltator]